MRFHELFDREYEDGYTEKVKVRYCGKIPQVVEDVLPLFSWGTSRVQSEKRRMERVQKYIASRIATDVEYNVRELVSIESGRMLDGTPYLDILFLPERRR